MTVGTNQFDFLTKPVVTAWLGMLKRSAETKREFNDHARQVNAFYSKPSGYMWKPEYMKTFMGEGIQPPKFQMTVNKPFEFVSIFLPMLWWDYPNRRVAKHKHIDIDPQEMSGGDPQKQQMLEQMLQQDAFQESQTELSCKLSEKYLNYSQLVQPGEGLSHHIEMALVDALVKGRGVLSIEPYSPPGSERTLTGAFYRSVDDLFIDPDCVDPTLTTARWVAIRHLETYWEVEDRFKLKRGTLKGTGTIESGNSQWDAEQGVNRERASGQSRKDLVEWIEIWSRCGIGTKLAGIEKPIYSGFDEVAGDFVYLCISPSMPNCPLNLQTSDLTNENFGGEGVPFTEEDLIEKLQWPTPTWMANRFPIALLDFNLKAASAWPIPPMAPAIGYMSCLNILVSCYTQQAYDNRNLIIAYAEGAVQDLKKKLESGDSPLLIGINVDEVKQQLSDVVQYLKRPEMNNDLPAAIEFVSQKIAESTGLLPLLYASNEGGVDRSAQASSIRNEKATLRPDHMGHKVGKWQTVVAEIEKIAMYYHVKAQDIAPLMGQAGASLWSELIENADPETMLHSLYCTVEASDMQKPDRTKQVGDLNKMMQWLLPILGTDAASTGDYTAVNGFVETMGDAMELDVEKLLVPMREPPPPDPALQAEQQAELELTNAKTEKLRMDTQVAGANAGQEQATHQSKLQLEQQKLEIERMKSEHGMTLAEATAEMNRQKAEHGMSLTERKAEMQRQQAEHGLSVKGAQAEQALALKQQQAEQALAAKEQQSGLGSQQAMLKLRLAAMQGQQKLQQQEAGHGQKLVQAGEQHALKANQAAMDMWQRVRERTLSRNLMPQNRGTK